MAAALALLVTGLVATACVGEGARVDERVALFDEVVFGEGDGGDGRDRLARWAEPVRIAVFGRRDDAAMTAVRDAASAMRAASGWDVALSNERGGANVVLFFEDADGFLAYLQGVDARVESYLPVSLELGYCWSTYWSRDGRIVSAALFIANSSAPEARRCLGHELAHAFGLSFHPREAYSVLNHYSATETYTNADRGLMALLYDRRLIPGMRRAEALAAARSLLAPD